MLHKQNVDNIIDKAEEESDFLTLFVEMEDLVNDLRNATEIRIQELESRAFKEVSDRKVATQTGFKKISYASFNREVLSYQEFKKQWSLEVVSERKPAALELAAL